MVVMMVAQDGIDAGDSGKSWSTAVGLQLSGYNHREYSHKEWFGYTPEVIPRVLGCD
jgi:hypothetical protein